MVEYSNPRLPDHVNNSETRPLREFAWLSGIVFGVLLLALVGLGLMAQWMAEQVPFDYETGLAEPFAETLTEGAESADPRIAAYLQGLADRLSPAMGLPPGMTIRVHYDPEETVNAMATLGGHVIVYRGLIEQVDSENALAMMMAHEMAHVQHRDPIVSIGRGVVIASVLGTLAGVSSSDVAAQFIGEAGLLTSLRFSRQQETDADRAGLHGVVGLYGHLGGALDLYRGLADVGGPPSPFSTDFFETHPDLARRVEVLEALAREQGWTLGGETTPLPAWLPEALQVSGGELDTAEP
jgi:predicted Zn-dependent protease